MPRCTKPEGTREVEFFVSFSNEEEKLKFVDHFCHLAMNNWAAPFRDQYIGNEGLVLINDFFLKSFNSKFPDVKFVEADKDSEKYKNLLEFGKNIEPSWGDDY